MNNSGHKSTCEGNTEVTEFCITLQLLLISWYMIHALPYFEIIIVVRQATFNSQRSMIKDYSLHYGPLPCLGRKCDAYIIK